MKILFCGSSGFLGRFITKALESRHRITPFNIEDGFDMTRDDLVQNALRGHDIALLFGAPAVGRRNMDRVPGARVREIEGVQNFASAASKAKIPIVYASSIRVYGSSEEMACGEVLCTHPVDAYGKMKRECEQTLWEYSNSQELQYIVLRMAAVFGPGMPDDFIISLLFSSISKGIPLRLSSKGVTPRNFLYGEDLGDFVLRLLDKSPFPANEIFNVANDESVSLIALAEIIGDVLSRKTTVLPGQRDEIPESDISVTKAHNLLGWTTRTTIREGIQKTASLHSSKDL